ncbi:fasciclin domain-containing protein [Loa loa]|uniref:Fasciclin domain-containing protein n=1 Tax=Loa loa TaxID=7209 RepID=A0A1S0TSB9_LOALO|nr:fasciclin domain-containing protein [Loa loa]EFO19382.2 fasciclin domain-containing protein [Loa loa]
MYNSMLKVFTERRHACAREKRVLLLWKASESTCMSHKRAMRCVTGDSNGTLIRIVECCDGYHTSDIKKGCTPYDAPETLNELLYGKNVCIETLEPSDTKFTTLLVLQFLNICYFASSIDFIERYNRNWNEYILEQPYHTYEMLNSQKLPTRKPGAFIIISRNPERTGLDNKPLLNCIEIVDEDLECRNGTVQLLSAPLPKTTMQTLLDIITNDPNFSVFSASTKHLRHYHHQTRMHQRKGCARELIKEHIYDGMLCSLFKENHITSITGIKHRFYKQRDGNNTEWIRLDNGRILNTDRVASNGVIHVIDDIILREQSATDWRDHLELPSREFLEILERNIGYEYEPVAIFVPPDDSFRNMTDEKSFVMNHIAINDSHITNKLIETAYGSKIPSSVNSPRPVFGCAKAIKPSTKYCNTTIYSIDAPLPKTMHTLEELITGRREFSVFASLLNDSNINLETNRLYTVFLPSNDALSNNQVRALKMNKMLVTNFVGRHIFEGLLCSKNLQVRTSEGELPVVLKNIRGEYYDGRRVGKKTTLGDIDLQDMDMLARNGILHTLESPLESQTSREHQTLCSVFDFI